MIYGNKNTRVYITAKYLEDFANYKNFNFSRTWGCQLRTVVFIDTYKHWQFESPRCCVGRVWEVSEDLGRMTVRFKDSPDSEVLTVVDDVKVYVEVVPKGYVNSDTLHRWSVFE